jgi:hypothetical protein
MNEESKRRLTNFLGECWHEWEPAEHVTFKCKLCGKWIYEKHAWDSSNRRTFTTPDDYFAVFDRLVELGEWEEFYMFATSAYKNSFALLWRDVSEWAVSRWLHSKTDTGEYRLCWLVGEWKEGKG